MKYCTVDNDSRLNTKTKEISIKIFKKMDNRIKVFVKFYFI